MTTIICFLRSRRSKFSDKPETYSWLYSIGCDHSDRLDVLMALCLRSGGVENVCFTETSGTLGLYSGNCSGKFLLIPPGFLKSASILLLHCSGHYPVKRAESAWNSIFISFLQNSCLLRLKATMINRCSQFKS